MWRKFCWSVLVLLLLGRSPSALAQDPWTWEKVRQKFESNNPTLRAGHLSVDEARANETTANLRPNPQLGVVLDEFPVFNANQLSPNNAQWTPTISELFERQGKRHLRYQSAQLATKQSSSDAQDLERNLIFNLRDAFIRLLAAKSVLDLATDNLTYYGHVIEVNQNRYKFGEIAKIDMQRVELQKAQFEADYQNAQVSQRQAKLDLLALMNDKTPADAFDVVGDFDFKEDVPDLATARQAAMDSRPDLQSAVTAVDKAKVDHKLAWANGSTDPTLGLEYQRMQAINTLGVDFAIPLRIFDRNQGEKQRTQIEIERAGTVREALLAGVMRDVDSAHSSLLSLIELLKPYRRVYIPESTEVRETVSFSYAHGGASLIDFLDAQREYRDTQLNYRNLIASYLSAANQLNLTVGREVIP